MNTFVSMNVDKPECFQRLEEMHQQVFRLFNALITLSAAQQQANNSAEWQAILARKQVVLQEISGLSLGSMFEDTRSMMQGSVHPGATMRRRPCERR